MGKCTGQSVTWGWARLAAGWDTGLRLLQPGGQKREASGTHCLPGLVLGRWCTQPPSSPVTILSPCDPVRTLSPSEDLEPETLRVGTVTAERRSKTTGPSEAALG